MPFLEGVLIILISINQTKKRLIIIKNKTEMEKKDNFYSANIMKKEREIKKFLSELSLLKDDEKIEDRFELYNEAIIANKKLFKLLKQYSDIQYSEFKNIPKITFSKKNLLMIKNKFLEFYEDFSSYVQPLKKEMIQIDFNEEEKLESNLKKRTSNVLEDDEENIWSKPYEFPNIITYEERSDTSNKYIVLNFDSSSLNSNNNEF